jgi:hypothetical protein
MPKKISTPSETLANRHKEEVVVKFSGLVKISNLERELGRSYSITSRAEKTVFDLSAISWIGYLPAALLFNWAAALITKHGHQVQFLTRPYDEMSDQVRGILLGQGIMDGLKDMGAEIPYNPPPMHRRGQPLTHVSTVDELWESLQETAESIVSSQKLAAVTDRVLRDAFQTILYELVENSLIHTNGAFPHYGVSLAQAGKSMGRPPGFITPFEPGTDYLEVYVGDLGRGVQAGLEQSMPGDYEPPFVSDHHFLKAEKALAYAFEFSTTSDVEGRLKRLRELLMKPEVDPTQIATGLYCVTELTRSLAGQFLLRTPKAVLSLKFYPERYEPEIRGRRELGIEKLGALPGTHYLVRLPLTVVPTRKVFATSIDVIKSSIHIRTLDAFGNISKLDSVETLQYAIKTVDEYLIRNRQTRQIVIVMRPRVPLPSRAEALFIAAIASMSHGQCLIIWANEHARFTIRSPQRSLTESGPGQSMLIGDLFSNTFSTFGGSDRRWRGLLEESQDFGTSVHLKDSVISNVRIEHRKALDKSLRLILSSADVKHSGDSFLLEGQYYTDTFYEIDRAWEDQNNIRLFAEWALAKLPRNVDVLIAHATPVFPMVSMLAELMKEYLDIEPIVIAHGADQSPAKTISQLVSLSGHRAVIVTDVICTADRLNRFLSLVTGLELDRILALVDGRNDERRQPIAWSLPTENRFLKIDAIVTEKIQVYADPPTRTRGSRLIGDIQDERIYVIDRSTRAPTLYVRPAKPQLKFERVLKGPSKESKALLYSHVSFRTRHYLYFLNFPRLFEHLQNDIMEWIKGQINFVEQSPRKGEAWHAYVYNPDESLSWLIESLTKLPQKPSVRGLSYDHLRAPLPPRDGESSGNWVIVLPALASGETARLCLEYVSRHNPATLLLLCVASRMEPYHLTFFTNIKDYGGAVLHSACFMEFPVPSFAGGRGTCPQCTEVAKLRELRDTARNYSKESSELVEAIGRAIAVKQEIPLGEQLQDEWLAREPTARDFDRAYLRALYEAAFLSIDDRRKLNALLHNDQASVDRFLEMLSAERYNEQFSKEMLNSILYKADATVQNRLLQIISDEGPPLPIGRFMGAISHLLPHVFVSNAVSMINRYSASQRDVEEICIALLQIGIEPSGVGEFFEFFHSEPSSSVSALFRETLDLLRATQDKDRTGFDRSVEATVDLWAQLARSSQFSEAIASLAQTPIEQYMSYEEIELLVGQVSREWKNRILELVVTIQSGPLWPILKIRRTQIPTAVTRIESSIAKLQLMMKADRQSLFGNDAVIAVVHTTAKELDHACGEMGTAIYSLFVNPVMCSAAELGTTLVTNDGSKLRVVKEIDQSVPRVFFDFDDLQSVCGQLIGNWKKHKTSNKKGNTVHFKVTRSGQKVVLEFSDNIEGEFDMKSRGGLGFVRKCCQEYGVVMETEILQRQKSLRIFLRAVE